MSGFYLRAFQFLPEFLKRRIHPLEYRILALVDEAAALPEGSFLLDAGAGEARFRERLSSHRYVAVDSAVGEAGWDYSRLDVRADLHRLPFPSSTYDGVLSTQVLEHVRDPGAMLGELARVLKPDGRLFLSAPQGWHEHQQPNDFYRFTRFSLEQMLESAGLHLERIEPMGGYFHYLGHRLTYLPKVLFSRLSGVARVVWFPVELACLAFFCGLLPLICYYLDHWDRQREFTLGYECVARKPPLAAGTPSEFATKSTSGLSLVIEDSLERGRPDSTEVVEAVDACRGAASSLNRGKKR